MRLSDVATIRTNFPEAHFWLVRRGSAERCGEPVREFATFAPLIVLAVWIGLYPSPFLTRLETSVSRVVTRVSPQYAAQPPAVPVSQGAQP